MNKKQILLSLSIISILSLGKVYAYDFQSMPPQAPPEHGRYQNFTPPKPPVDNKGQSLNDYLGLTEAQREQVKKNNEESRAKIQPIMKKMAKKKYEIELIMISNDSDNVKHQKLEVIKGEMGALKVEADTIRKENMDKFISILTPEQKIKFETYRAQKIKEAQAKRAEFEKNQKKQTPLGSKTK